MMATDMRLCSDAIRRVARPIRGRSGDYDALLQAVGDRRFVLLGEASHGTHEFYRERARISRRLIEEKQFDAIAVEADWPDALRVDRYLRATSRDRYAEQALEGFERFPTWMWRNRDVVDFIEWLHRYNGALARDRHRVGFYGLDLYSLFTSIDQVLRFLQRFDPVAAARARQRYSCFDHCDRDSQRYAFETTFGSAGSCEEAVVAQLRELHERVSATRSLSGQEAFYAEQNARVVKNAEAYYRTMYRGDVSSWNLRDGHMADMLDALALHLQRRNAGGLRCSAAADAAQKYCSQSEVDQEGGKPPKIIVWEHNSHIGDARATEMGRRGEWTLGQLARERHGAENVLLVGFSTHSGSVTAASEWGGAHQRKLLNPSLPQSYEAVFHETGLGNFLLPLHDDNPAAQLLREQRLTRAVGVIYRPDSERQSHYFYSTLPQQFDLMLHFDKSRAVEPLDAAEHWAGGEAPETFPVGI